jgi:flavin-dependent dehydrogenase
MSASNSREFRDDYDVAICGSGLAGLTLARQLQQQLPEISIVLIDRLSRPLPEAAFKVGEAVTEAGAYYLAETLNLSDYFSQSHFYKLGFRFFFGDASGPFQDRPEFGISEFPIVGSYNIDRGILENDLRQFNADAGVTILEGCSVQDIVLSNGNGRHEIVYKSSDNGNVGKVRSRWVIDAMGRRLFLQKKLNLTKGRNKKCSAVWFRLNGRIDVSDLVPRDLARWHNRVPNDIRYYSANHLMGKGYWVWLIPLSSGNTSIGIVALEDIHPFSEFNTHKLALHWLRKHEPALARYIEDREPLDFRCMRHYSYSSKQVFSSDRWACVGEAGVFADPLYSPAVDLIALGNSFTTHMIGLSLNGKLTPDIVRNYDQTILALNDVLTQNIQIGYPLFGNAVVMAAKVIWDTAAGWALLAPQIFNSIFLDSESSTRVRRAKARYFFLTKRMQQLFVDWESLASGRFTFEYIDFLRLPLLQDLRVRNLEAGKSREELVEDQVANMDRIEELAQALFLLALEDVRPEYLETMPRPIWLNAWGISLNPKNWQANQLFQPTSKPRDLNGIREQIRSLFRCEDS